jgi:hypothetical protein
VMPGFWIRPELRAALAELRRERPAGILLPRGLHAFEDDGTLLIAESTWTWLMAHVPETTKQHYARWPTT